MNSDPRGFESTAKFGVLIRQSYELLVRWGGPVVLSLVVLLFRIIWGLEFFQAGKGKLQHIDVPIGFFKELGIPAPVANAWLVAIVETFGGLLLVSGFFSRFAAAALTINMIVAYLTADHAAVVALFSKQDMETFSKATPFWFLITSLLVLGVGPGLISIDAVLKRLLFGRHRRETVLPL